MDKLLPLKKLDKVLLTLKESHRKAYVDFLALAELLRDSIVDFGEILAILEKLHKDGYIYYDDRAVTANSGNDKRVYRLNFEGSIFIDLGGYEQQEKDKISLRRLQSLQTWLIVLGTLAAGISGIVYLIKLFVGLPV